MAAGISPVGSNVYLYHIITLDVVVLFGWSSHLSLIWQHDDSAVVSSNAYLVLCTNHAATLYATQLAALDGKDFITIIQFGAYHSYYHLLSTSHIGSATYYLEGIALTDIDSTNMHVITVGMRFTSQNLTNPKAFQTTLHGLNFFYAIDLKSCAGQGICHFLCAKGCVDVFTKPFIRDIHICLFVVS